MEFATIDFETTGYENGGTNEPWQLGVAFVRDSAVVGTREWFFDVEGLFRRDCQIKDGEAVRWVKSVRAPSDWDALFGGNACRLLDL